MVLPLVLLGLGAIGGTAWVLGKVAEEPAVTTNLTENKSYVSNYSYQTETLTIGANSKVYGDVNMSQTSKPSSKIEQKAETKADSGILTASNVNTALYVGGALAVGYFILKVRK